MTGAVVATLVTGALAATTVGPADAHTPLSAAHQVAARAAAPKPATFQVASFNVLGASHTPEGNKRASGATRIVWAHQLLVKHGVDVAGFQEMQASQLTKFLAITDGKWATYPGLSGKRIDSENSIGWRTARFELVQSTMLNIPYFNGNPRAMPLVLLRDKKTGVMAYFTNYHNPAETAKYKNQGKWRVAASKIEIALQNQLAPRGLPRFVTGDMNERADYFCRVTAAAPLKAARPTSVWKHGTCSAGKPRAVDWILGAKKVTFSGYNEDRSALDEKTTDHPVITTSVTVDPARLPRAFASTPPAPIVPAVSWQGLPG